MAVIPKTIKVDVLVVDRVVDLLTQILGELEHICSALSLVPDPPLEEPHPTEAQT